MIGAIKKTEVDKMEASRVELVKKIVQVIREVGAVPKSGKNDHFGYSYRRHEDITNKLQPALAASGIVIVPMIKEIVREEPGYILMRVTYTVTDGAQELAFVGIGEGQDKSRDGRAGDKAAYKAQTGAMKYALNDLLLLAGEDPEADNKTHNDAAPEKPKATPKAEEPVTFSQHFESNFLELMDGLETPKGERPKYWAHAKLMIKQSGQAEGEKKSLDLLTKKYQDFLAKKGGTNVKVV